MFVIPAKAGTHKQLISACSACSACSAVKYKDNHMAAKNNKETGHELAYQLAREELMGIMDLEEQCRKCDAQYIDSQKTIIIKYLNQSYQITLPDMEVTLEGNGEEVSLKDKILILHYLIQAKGTPLSNKMIAYKELPEGSNYFPTFYQRAIRPLVQHFGNEPQRLLDAGKTFGAHEADHGDVSITVNTFSRAPVTLLLWRGDDEFPPEGNILFDSTISDYLSPEDINVLCETLVERLAQCV